MENVTKKKKFWKSYKDVSRETIIGSIILSLAVLVMNAGQLWLESPDSEGYFVLLGLILGGIGGYYLYLGRFEDAKKAKS